MAIRPPGDKIREGAAILMLEVEFPTPLSALDDIAIEVEICRATSEHFCKSR